MASTVSVFRPLRQFLDGTSVHGGYGLSHADPTDHSRIRAAGVVAVAPAQLLDPGCTRWSSMTDDLSKLSWVFAHGSLMFDADFDATAVLPGRAWGWARRFGQPSVRNWGTEAAPAPTCSLSRGAFCDGLLLGLPGGGSGSILATLVRREANEPATITVSTGFGDTAAYTWLMSDAWASLGVDELASHGAANVRAGGGPRGNAWQYVAGVHETLSAHGLEDELVTRYAERLRGEVAGPDPG